MPKYYVQTYHRVWNQLVVEADSKSEARETARQGGGERVDHGICTYNVSAPSRAIIADDIEEGKAILRHDQLSLPGVADAPEAGAGILSADIPQCERR